MEPRLVEKMSKAIALLFGLEKSLGNDTGDIAKFLHVIGQMREELEEIAHLNASDFAHVISVAQDLNASDNVQGSEKHFKYWTHEEVVSMLESERNDYSLQFDITMNSNQVLHAMHILSASTNGYVVIQDSDDTTDDALWIERSSVKHIEYCDTEEISLHRDLIPLAVSMALTNRWKGSDLHIAVREACNVIDDVFVSNKVRMNITGHCTTDADLTSYEMDRKVLVFTRPGRTYKFAVPFSVVRSIQSSGTY